MSEKSDASKHEKNIEIHGSVSGDFVNIGGTQTNYINIFMQQALAHGLRTPFNAPTPPTHYVHRQEEHQQLVSLLKNHQTVALITALQGGGGYGKTTLAQAICHDAAIRQEFKDGILWIVPGENPNILALMLDQIELLTGTRPGFVDIHSAATALDMLIEERRLLLVLDDVWQVSAAQSFLRVGKRCAKLITTRSQEIVSRIAAQPVNVNQMTVEESSKLLVKGLEESLADMRPFQQLAQDLGGLALVISLARSYLIASVTLDGELLDSAHEGLKKRLNARGFTAFDRTDEKKRDSSFAICMEVSLERLGKQRERYLELAMFPQDIEIPWQTIGQLWQVTADFDDLDTEDALKVMNRLSLFTKFDGSLRVLMLHDVVRAYLATQLKDVPRLHCRLLEKWGDLRTLPDEYAWHNVAYHLREAGKIDTLHQLVLDFQYLQGKLRATDVNALLADCNAMPDDTLGRLVKSALQMSAHVLMQDKKQLASQLNGRLSSYSQRRRGWIDFFINYVSQLTRQLHIRRDNPEISTFLDAIQPGNGALFLVNGALNLAGGPLTQVIVGHLDSVSSVTYSSNGKWLASCSLDDSVLVWDVETGLQQEKLHAYMINRIVYSPDSKWLAGVAGRHYLNYGTYGCRIIVWDTFTGKESGTLDRDKNEVWCLTYSPDSKWLVAGSQDKSIISWNLETGEQQHFLGHSSRVESLAYSPDGKWLASGLWDKKVIVWDTYTRQPHRTLLGHSDRVVALAYSPDGRWLASGSIDKTIIVWDMQNGEKWRILKGHSDYVASIAYSPNGRWLASGSGDKTIILWDINKGQPHHRLVGHSGSVTSLAYSPDGRWLASGSWDKTIIVWDTGSRVKSDNPTGFSVNALAYSPDGRWLASGSSDKTIIIWNMRNGQQHLTLNEHSDRVVAVAYSPDGRWLASGSWDKTIIIWNVRNGQQHRTLNGHTSWVDALAYSPDGRWLASGSNDKTIIVWNMRNGQQHRILNGHTSQVHALAYSPDGRWLASGSSDERVIVWDIETGIQRHNHAPSLDKWLEIAHYEYPPSAAIMSVTFSPNGKLLASGLATGKIIIWDSETGGQRYTLKTHSDTVMSVVYHPDNKWFASCSRDCTIIVYDVATGEVITRFFGDAPIIACAWSPDGAMLVAGDELGRVLFLKWIPPELSPQ